MALWHDEKYLKLVSSQLEQFKQKQAHTYNFRCPLCGDSEKNPNKARFYVFPLGQKLMGKCHNCSISLPFSNLLNRLNPGLWNDYLVESLDQSRPSPEKPSESPVAAPVARIPRPMDLTPLAAAEPPTSPYNAAWRFARARALPKVADTRLFVTDAARTWLEPLVGDKIGPPDKPKVKDGSLFIVQPLRLPDGEWYGAQLRAVDRKDYLTFRWAHDPLKMFGLEAWNPDQHTWIVEGPMDALFVPNAIAACGSDLHSAVVHMEHMQLLPHKTRRTFVWDNEPRNKEVTRHIRNAIKLGESVVIWPKDFPKDINDAVKGGMSMNSIFHLMERRTVRGLMAELEFEHWKA